VSVLTTSNRVDYNGDGVTKTFAFSFPIYNLSDLQVWTNDSAMTTNAPEGLALRKLNGVDPFDYVQSIVNFPGGVKGGSITFTVAPPTNMKVILLRVLSETQAQEFGNFDKQDAKQAVEQGFDRLVMEVQQLREQLNQALAFPVEILAADPTLPPVLNPSSTEIIQIGYNSTGTGLKIRRVPAGVRNFTFSGVAMSRVAMFTTGTSIWTVPAGVTTAYVEFYGPSGGGGGGGVQSGGSNGSHGYSGGRGGYGELYFTTFTPGEIIDIFIGTPGAAGAKSTGGGPNGGGAFGGAPVGAPPPNGAYSLVFARRAPNAADIARISSAEGGPGGQNSQVPTHALAGGFQVFHEAAGGSFAGSGNFDIGLGGGAGFLKSRGQYGGPGGDGGYTVSQREVDLGENDVLTIGAIIDPKDGSAGNPGRIVIYY